NRMSGAISASVTGRRNALRASVDTMRDAHASSLRPVVEPIAFPSGESRRSRAEAPRGAEAGEVGRHRKTFLRFGVSTGAPFGSKGPSIVTVGAVSAPRPVTAVVPGLNVPVLA